MSNQRRPSEMLSVGRGEPLLGVKGKPSETSPFGRDKSRQSGEEGSAETSGERDEPPMELTESLLFDKDLFPKRATGPAPTRKPTGLPKALLRHLLQAHPVDAILMGAAGASAFVEAATQKALRYGFERPDDVRCYLDLTVMLGQGFDTDPQLARVNAALRKSSKPSMDELFDGALAYLGRVSGETGDLYVKALLRARKCAAMSLVGSSCGSGREASTLLRRIHPEKLVEIQDQLEPMFARAETLTRRHSEGVWPLYLVLMFLLGSEFEADPRYAWAAETLSDTRIPGEPVRYKKLHKEGLARLDFALRARGDLGPSAREVG